MKIKTLILLAITSLSTSAFAIPFGTSSSGGVESPLGTSIHQIQAVLSSDIIQNYSYSTIKNVAVLPEGRLVVELVDEQGNCVAEGVTVQETFPGKFKVTPDGALRSCVR